jgi:hypothetical protein
MHPSLGHSHTRQNWNYLKITKSRCEPSICVTVATFQSDFSCRVWNDVCQLKVILGHLERAFQLFSDLLNLCQSRKESKMDTSQNSLSFCVQSNMEWSEHSLSHARKSLNYEPKKLPCRYGIGCTHIRDAIHLERFTHPPIPVLDRKFLPLF